MTKYLINSEKKIVTQKATMEKPVDTGQRVSYYAAQIVSYQEHIRSLKSFPAEWVTADQDGLEVELDKDFRLQYQCKAYGVWNNNSKEVYEAVYTEIPERCRIVAVAIPAEKEGGGHDAIKERMKEFFKTVTPEYLIEQFEAMGYKFVPIDSPTTEPVEEKEDGLDRGNYWKERCMAAEKCIHLLGSWSQPSGQHHNYQMAYSDWQTFKKLKDENE